MVNADVVDCRRCPTAPSAILCGQGRGLEAFLRLRRLHRFGRRQVIFHEDTPATTLYLLCAGRVKLVRTDGAGRQQILRIVDPGETLGEECLLPGAHYAATAETLEDSQAAFVQREDLLRLLDEGDGTAVRFLLHLCRVLVSLQARLSQVALGDARSRLARLLLDLGRRYGESQGEGTRLNISLTRRDIAALVGLTPETAMRLLSEFRREGILRTTGRQILVLDAERLAALA